jgi:hypothetical protein
MNDSQKVTDTLGIALDRAKAMVNNTGVVGYGVATLTGPDGKVKECIPFHNLVTTAGDKWYAQAATAAAGGAAASPGAPNGMRLGTATTAVHKSTSGGASISSASYIATSNELFDSTVSAAAKTGTDTGWEVTYVTVWESGGGSLVNATIQEVSIVNDAATDTGAASATVANTYSRAVITNVNKAEGDTLTVTWKHLFLGA